MAQADEQQFQAWEKLVDEGVPRFEAAQQAGTTLRRLKNADQVRFADGVELERERQAAKAEVLLAEQLDRPEPSPQLVALELKSHHPDYADKTRIEIDGRIEHTHHGRFDIGALARIAAERGVIDARPVRALAEPREVLPGPAERAAGDLPAA